VKIKKVAVVGAGVMGSGIAYLCAWKGYEVSVNEISEELLERGLGRIKELIATGLKQGKLTSEEAKETMMRIKGTTDACGAARDAEIVIEAISEDMTAKKELFKQLGMVCPSCVIFASNTSALSINELSTATKRPDKVIGLHFFNPAYALKLVEVIMGEQTSKETQEVIKNFAVSLGKEVVVAKDTPGFIVNRILSAALTESIFLLQGGVASAEDIDRAMTSCLNWPMGPLKLADFVGLDVVLDVNKTIYKTLGKGYEPPSMLEEKVKAGCLGVKNKKGFYDY